MAITVALLVAACGSADPPRPYVALLPAQGASSHVWRWTPQCPIGPAASKGCGAAGPVLGFAQLNGDEWNLGGPADAGSLDMSVGSAGAVTIKGLFTRTAPCTESACLAPSAYTWVRGYPSVLYGVNQCHADTSPPKSPQLPLPMRLDSIPPHLIGVTAYSASTSQVTYDVAYDLWLHPTDTRRPCNSEGTLEIMVWTDYDARALLPAGMQVGTATIPSAVNGVARGNTQNMVDLRQQHRPERPDGAVGRHALVRPRPGQRRRPRAGERRPERGVLRGRRTPARQLRLASPGTPLLA